MKRIALFCLLCLCAVVSGSIEKDATDQTFHVYAVNEISGLPVVSLQHGDITARYTRVRAEPTTITMASVNTNGVYAAGGFCAIDQTNCKGWYRFDVPDAAFATGVDRVLVTLQATDTLIAALNVALVEPVNDPTIVMIADAVWDEEYLGHESETTAGGQLWGDIDAILLALQGSVTCDVSITPLTAATIANRDIVQNIEVYQHASGPTLTWSITDADGDAVDLSAVDLLFLVYNYAGAIQFSLATGGSGLTVGGGDNNQVTATYSTTNTATAGNYTYELWKEDDPATADELLATGIWSVLPTIRSVP